MATDDERERDVEMAFFMAAGRDGSGKGDLVTVKRLVEEGLVSVNAVDDNGSVMLARSFCKF